MSSLSTKSYNSGNEWDNTSNISGSSSSRSPNAQAKETGPDQGYRGPILSGEPSEQQRFDESRGKAQEHNTSNGPWKINSHQLAPSAGNPLNNNPYSDHGVDSQQSRDAQPTSQNDTWKKLAVGTLVGPLLGTTDIGVHTIARYLLGLPQGTTDWGQRYTCNKRATPRLGVWAMPRAVTRTLWPGFAKSGGG
ncbi:hypothetical protein LIER_39574 [Lithospermum erythrorhizon]|uniref:Uncharacterized protein n=1 Tax=Lithospermum erythrorhizon TaxID=34254 RepID=A0AAV3QMC4_LITER